MVSTLPVGVEELQWLRSVGLEGETQRRYEVGQKEAARFASEVDLVEADQLLSVEEVVVALVRVAQIVLLAEARTALVAVVACMGWERPDVALAARLQGEKVGNPVLERIGSREQL